MSRNAIVTIRLTSEEKRRLMESARRQKRTVTALVKKRLTPDIGNASKNQRRRPTEAARQALARFIGAVRSPKKYRLTNEEIDRIVYGDPGCQSLERFWAARRRKIQQGKVG